jgi:hypothetical protein
MNFWVSYHGHDDRPGKFESKPVFFSVAEKRQPPHVILSEAKNLSHIEILRYAQDDKTDFRNRNELYVCPITPPSEKFSWL